MRFVLNDLLEYAELRNAIVHDRGRSPVLLADPRDDVVSSIEDIWGRLSNPQKLRSVKRPSSLQVFSSDDPLVQALSYMRRNNFSQVVTLVDQKHVILSSEGIAHWLEERSKDQIIDLAEWKIGDALKYEPLESCIYLKADNSIDRAREVFANDLGKRIFAVLVMEHGRPKEKPVNLVTPWDMMKGKLSARR